MRLPRLASILSLTLLLLTACGGAGKDTETKTETEPKPLAQDKPVSATTSTTTTSSIEAKQVAAESEAANVAEVAFTPGKTQLSKAAQAEIRALLEKAGKRGKVDEVRVVTWADQEYPSANAGTLSEKQRKLATERNDNIKGFLASLNKDLKVELHSMAERPNALQRLVSSGDSRLKRSLETAGIPNTESNAKSPSKASKSIVMIIMDEQ